MRRQIQIMNRPQRLPRIINITKGEENMNTDNVFNRIKFLENKYHKQFKNIIDENYYLSEDGEVYSYHKSSTHKIKPFLRKDGYLEYKIYHTHYKVHRLVAVNFIPNNNTDLDIINHKDGNKINNHYSNLEWCSSRDNNYHAWNTSLNNSIRQPKWCCALDDNYNILNIFESISDLSKFYEVDNSTASKQCRGEKNRFQKGIRARYYDILTKTFIPTRFD